MLKELRLKHKLTQSQLSFLSGVSVKTISRIENGNTKVNYNTLLRLADFFEVKPKDIIKSDE